jgi:pimeloyl-ACP methyl ester carboxylesterase
MPYVTVNGLSMAYDREGSGPTLLMIHGASQDSRSWRFNVPFFAQWFDVIAVDLPGHGKSDLPPCGPVRSVPVFADYVWGLVEALGVTNPVLMGHSLAGGIVLRLALDKGDLVRAVVNVDGSARTNKKATRLAKGGLDLIERNPTDYLQTMFLSVLGRSTSAEHKRSMAMDARRTIPEVALCDLYAYTSCDFQDDLGSVTIPVIGVVGEDDWSCSPKQTFDSTNAVGGPSSYHMFKTVGHIPHTEQPEVFNEVVSGLMREHGLIAI